MKIIDRNSKVLKAGIEDLLMISRLDEKAFELKLENYDLISSLHEVISEMDPQRMTKGIRIELKAERPSEFIIADKKKLAQIWRILIDNAIKYSPEESAITISISDKDVMERMKGELKDLCKEMNQSVVIQSEDIYKRFKKLIVFDVESTLIQDTSLKNFLEKIKGKVKSMNGSLEFRAHEEDEMQTLVANAKMLKGFPARDFKAFGENLLNPNTCSRLDAWPSYHLIARIAKCKTKNMADKMGTVRITVFCITIIAKFLDMLAHKLVQIHYIPLSVPDSLNPFLYFENLNF